MEGALGERLKREFNLKLDETIGMAGLIYSEKGKMALKSLWSEYAEIAKNYDLPFLATTPTRRTNKETIALSHFDSSIIKSNIDFLREVQRQQSVELYIGGLLGCRGDAYTGIGALSLDEAKAFHTWEVSLFASQSIDFLYAALMPTLEEAAGMALAIETFKIPYMISFTIKRDGCLIDGTPIAEAIAYIDALTSFPPIGYMTNCVHPQIVYEALSKSFNRKGSVRERFMGIQANTSSLDYEELDHSIDLKTSDPVELAEGMVKLRELLPIKLFGGCCGTDARHMEAIAKRIYK